MIIRCERCSTLYELDEALLAPEGSPVQCTRCQSIFSARPPRPASEPAPAATPAPAAPAPAAPAAAPPPAEAPPPPRPVRTGPPVYRPPGAASAATTSPAARAGAGRRGPVGAVEQRAQRANLGRRLVLPAAALVIVALVAGGAALWRRGPDPEVQRLAAEASALLTQDDAGSLARAVQLCDAMLARARIRPDATAARAMARILLAAAQQEEAEPYAELLASRLAERERLQTDQQPGAEDALRIIAVEATRLEGEVTPRRRASEGLLAQAAGELKVLSASPGGEAAARGLALLAALAGDREETARLAAQARAAGPDPWADLAEAWLALRTPGGREPAEGALAKLAAAHPELLRARWLLARTQAAQGHREEATATLSRLLAANPRHERAQRLRAALAVPPAQAPAQPAQATVVPPARPPQVWVKPLPPVAPALAEPAAPAGQGVPAAPAAPGDPAAQLQEPPVAPPPAAAPVEPAPPPPAQPPPQPQPKPKPREPAPDVGYEPG